MFRIVVTDANYKNAIAFARYAKRGIPDLYIVGHSISHPYPAKWHSCYDRVVTSVSLQDLLQSEAYDMVVPIGGNSVLTVSQIAPGKAVLPVPDKIDICFDKVRTLAFAREHGIPVPTTLRIGKGDALTFPGVVFPCVVKAAWEHARSKSVDYCHDSEALEAAVGRQLAALGGDGDVLVQEFVAGEGHGLFALFDRGKPLRVFMHRRMRESPPSGGISTAAQAFHSERLKELGLKLLTALGWHGVAMVEFRRNDATGEFVLMEINGKFWGSLELSLAAGVNFAADLIRLYRGETLPPQSGFDQNCEFYWPLDGDILTLWKTRKLGRIKDYWRPNARTNVGQSWRSDVRKLAGLVIKVIVS